MSNTRYPWWGYARKIIYLYPERCRQYQEMLRQNITPGYCEQVGGHTASRTVEQVAVRAMSKTEYKEYEAVRQAISATTNADMIHLIKLLFWQKHQKFTIYGAAAECNISYATARRWCRRFIMLVAEKYGLLE